MKKWYALFISIYFLVYIAPLGVRPLINQDETRYAEISREMIESKDWVVPRLNGLRYFEKPVMGYWLNAASMKAFGENAFAGRLPSAMAVGLSAVLLFFMVRRFSDDERTAFLSVLVFSTCLFVFGVGVYLILDSIFSAFMTGALASFFYAYKEENRSVKRIAFLVIFGLFVGFAFLTKGFLAFALPAVVIGPFLLWERKIKELFLLPWVPILAAVLVILPWAILIHIREPDYWRYFFWTENIHRFAAEDAQHKEPFFYYMLWLPVALMPWTFILPAAFRRFDKKYLKNPLIRYAICWFVFPFLLFTAAEGKILTYILPCFPAMAVVAAFGLKTYMGGSKWNGFKYGAWSFGVILAVSAVGIGAIQVVGCNSKWPYCHDDKWMVVFASALSSALLLFFATTLKNRWKGIVLFAAAAIPIMLGFHFSIPQSAIPSRAPGEFFLHHKADVSRSTIIVSDQKPFQAVCWFFKRNDVYFLENCGELKYGIGYEDSKYRMLNLQDFKALIASNPGKVLLIISDERFDSLQKNFPTPSHFDSNGRIAMAWF